MAFRILQYIIQLYHSLRKQDPRMKRLPPVFPLVLYNGEAPWTAPLEFADLIHPQLAGSYIPRFEYVKLAENEFRREELLQIRNLVGALFLVETSSVAEYASTVQHIVGILEGAHPEVYKEMLRWLWHTIGREAPAELDTIPLSKEVSTMLAAELQREREAQWQKGKAEGISEGLQKGKLEGKKETARKLKARGMDIQEIADITGLSIEMIKSL